MISLEEFAKRQEEAERKFGRYAKAVIEWAFLCPDSPPPDARAYFEKPLSEECRMPSWSPISTAPEGKPVRTAIIEDGRMRNVSTLVRKEKLWFFPDMSMYVYYTPTHWRELEDESEKANH